MTVPEGGFSLVHFSGPQFGSQVDLSLVEGLERFLPDVQPRVFVITGSLTHGAKHGEFQRARAMVRELERTAPVLAVPGSRDVQWWRRPLIPVGEGVKYENYVKYFGPNLAPTLEFPEAIIASARTSHGVAWGSLTFRPRQLLTRGYLPKREASRLESILSSSSAGGIRLLALHHSAVPNGDGDSAGLSRANTALARLVGTGADVLLCSNSGKPTIDVYGGVVLACGGSLSAADCKGSNPIFRRITVSEDSIKAEEFLWQPLERVFSKGDVHVFSRRKVHTDG